MGLYPDRIFRPLLEGDEFFVFEREHAEISTGFKKGHLVSKYRGRSPVLCIRDQGRSIARHETQGTEVLPELSAIAGEVGRPRGAA